MCTEVAGAGAKPASIYMAPIDYMGIFPPIIWGLRKPMLGKALGNPAVYFEEYVCRQYQPWYRKLSRLQLLVRGTFSSSGFKRHTKSAQGDTHE